jgi:RNA polymerase sigma-70 factor, ECF subfamily
VSTADAEVDAGAVKRKSFQEEALPHLDAVYRFALRLTSSPDAAADLTQETFLRAFRNWASYTPGTRCLSWLFTICRNVFLRGRSRGLRHDEILRENVVDEDPRVPSLENPVFTGTRDLDPEADFFRNLLDDEILRALEALPEEYRTAVVLSDLEGLPYGEIAEVMDVPVGTVKSRLFRGRRRLQAQLREYATAAGYVTRKTTD